MNVVSFGGGTNSAAMIIGMYLHKNPIERTPAASSRIPTSSWRRSMSGW